MAEPSSSKDVSGWLSKWSNTIGGYEQIWFVLSGGILSFCTKEEDGSTQTCRGKISLDGAVIDFDETRKFVICQDGEALHIRADDQQDKQRWVEALTGAKDAASNEDQKLGEYVDSGTENLNNRVCEQFMPLTSTVEQNLENKGDKLHCSVEAPSPSIDVVTAARDVDSDEDQELLDSTDADMEFPSENPSIASQDIPQIISMELNHDNHNDELQGAEAMIAVTDTISTEGSESHNSYNAGNEIQHKNQTPSQQSVTLMNAMKQKLKDIQTYNDLINRGNSALQRSLLAMGNSQENEVFRGIFHHAAEYLENASAMTSACTDYMNLAEFHSEQWLTLYQSEHEQRIKLEQIVRSLTQTRSKSYDAILEDDKSLEYFEACCETASTSEIRHVDVNLQVYQAVSGPSGNQARRTKVKDRPNISDSLWSVLKNCIGTDLSKMPLPVSFAEPLSLLQRLTEDFEYAHLLDKASEFTDAATQLAYVATFIASSYSTTIGRTGKPFNPLLGETYECDRQSDLGWRSIAEQVSHHPPVAAIYGEGNNWELWMDQSMKTKFKGTTLTVMPLGECHLNFKNGNRYSWKKPITSIRNVIVGKLWVEQEGDVDIRCATSNVTGKLTFITSGWAGETFTLKGVIKDGEGKAVFDIIGKYSTQIEYRPAGSKDPGTVIWKRTEPPADNAKYYSFTLLACQLNEMENGIAPTDSRLRPDQRLMEEANFDSANVMKKKLEDHQRANKKEAWTPSWFIRRADPDTKTEIWTYGGEYWPCKAKKDWSRCPSHIFSPP